MDKTIYEVIIIGAGPAGISCAIQLKRYGITPLVIEKNVFGGLLRNANLVENYPGFPEGVRGRLLVDLFRKQFEIEKLSYSEEEVQAINFENNLFSVQTDRKVYLSEILVIASGTKPKKFQEIQITNEVSQNVFYDIFELLDVSNKEIVIVGAGDLAFDYALNLGRNNSITVLNRSQEIKCLPLLVARCKQLKMFKYFENTTIQNVSKANADTIIIQCSSENNTFELEADHIIFAIGREPELGFIDKNFQKLFSQLEKEMQLYFIGDVLNNHYRQTAIAAGDGVKSAMKIYKKLKGD